ncbi:MAG: C1 family peptidase [Phycisphaeraceae bacterium]
MPTLRPFATALLLLSLCAIAIAESQPVPIIKGDPAALSPALLDELRGNFKMDTQARVLHNAVTNNSIESLALNRDVVRGEDGHFSHRIQSQGITNQENTGRCWMFAGLNTMRPKVIAAYGLPQFEFSTAYLQFWDKMEKANLYLETMIEMGKTDFLDREWELVQAWTLDDGGWWNFVVDLIEKYGVVPKDVMPETASSKDTTVMNEVFTRMLHAYTVKIRTMSSEGKSVEDMRVFKRKALADVYRFLVINLGEPPREFEWRYDANEEAAEAGAAAQGTKSKAKSPEQGRAAAKPAAKARRAGQDKPLIAVPEEEEIEESSAVPTLTPLRKYTPKSFYEEYVGVSLRDYVCLYNDTTNPFMKHYRFTRAKNMAGADDMDFVNVDSSVLKAVTMKSIVANEPVWFAADVGKDQSTDLGLMADKLFDYGPLFGVDLTVSKADRVRFRAETSNHAMTFMGVDVREGKPVKWLVENSWGAEHGKDGTWTLYDKWFDEHVFVIIVNKKYIPAEVLKVFEEKATQLPAWYPGAPGVRR